MEHVNNDMDDLFRKAGDLYPLKTTGSDWDKMLGRLKEEDFGDETGVPGSDTKTTRFRRRWLVLLFLIPLGLGSVIYFSHSEKQAGEIALPISKKDGNPDQTARASRMPSDKVEKALPKEIDKPFPNQAGKISLSAEKTSPTVSKTPAGFVNSAGVSNRKEKSANNGNDLNNAGNAKYGAAAVAVTTAVNSKENTGSPKTESAQAQDSKSNAPVDSSTSTETKPAGVKPVLTANANNTTPENGSKAKTANTNKAASKGFYVGLMGGPDFSTVKFQGVNKTGLSLGVLVGYRINSRFSIESGIIWDKKYYYSSGEYFKRTPPVPSGVGISGSCNMLEIPLDFRYNFATAVKHSYFASAGLSSYLNMKEKYSFSNYPNVDKSYNGPSNIFSIMQLSAGYEYALGEKTKIRIEPYIKIPLAGVGTGSMPISSAGIYLGITRSFR